MVKCQNFTTPSNATYLRYEVVFTFNSSLSDTERNSLLCYIADAVVADYTMVLNRAGESCNNITAGIPKQLYYVYTGKTDFKTNDSIFINLIDNSSSSQTSLQNFKALFAINGSLTSTSNNYINQTVNGKLLTGVYNNSTGYAASRSANRTVSVTGPLFNQNGGYINVTNIMMSQPGQIFFGVASISAVTPSQEQLLNCQDGSNVSLNNCTRIIVPSGNIVNILNNSGLLASSRSPQYCRSKPVRIVLHARQ